MSRLEGLSPAAYTVPSGFIAIPSRSYFLAVLEGVVPVFFSFLLGRTRPNAVHGVSQV